MANNVVKDKEERQEPLIENKRFVPLQPDVPPMPKVIPPKKEK